MSQYGGYDDVPDLPEFYDSMPLYASRPDVEFYVDVCRGATGRVLDLGCGTGRILIPAAEAGCTITGLDKSALMLERCRSKVALLPENVRRRIRLVDGDMTQFALGQSFDLVIAPFRPLQHLITVDEQLQFLVSVAEHLEPQGRLVFDVFHVDPEKISGPPMSEEVEDTPEVPLADGRTLRRAFRVVGKRRSEQCNDVELIYYVSEPGRTTQRMVQSFPMRYFYRFELEHLLARAGFEIAALQGNFDKSPFSDTSPEMIVIANRRTG